MGFLGGFDFLGRHYEKTDFEIIWANDINASACDTYRQNIGAHIIPGDIDFVIDSLPDYADVVIGGFPCQDISINGKMLGMDGKRSSLYTAIVKAVSKMRPMVFVAENVKGLLMARHKDSLTRVIKDFSDLGYQVTYHLYHAADYGVPQARERVFIVGTRNDIPVFVPPAPTCGRHITAKEAVCDLEEREQDSHFSHIWSLANRSTEQGNRRLKPDKPAQTIRAECHGNIQFHYSLPRRISMREAARFQSFPDDFIFCAKLRETERQVGNAVPPVLAWHVAKEVQETISRGERYFSTTPRNRLSNKH